MPSTHQAARSWAYNMEPKKAVWLCAAQQTQGIGTRGRSFCSPIGGLYCTLILSWPFKANLSLLPLFLSGSILKVLPISCGLKWMNDLHVDGQKLGGVMLEAKSLNFEPMLLISVGVNVNTDPHHLSGVQRQDSWSKNPTSLKQVLGYSLDIGQFFYRVRQSVYECLHRFCVMGNYDCIENVSPLLWGWQKKVSLFTVDRKKEQGIWTDIDPHRGYIILDNTRSYRAKSVVPYSWDPNL
jgi:BirA family transcriptional regulator, biotin operon repressor / biotin---[acetyl-CoA-carboxylase] ligase